MVAGTAVSIIGCDWLGLASIVKARAGLELQRFPVTDVARLIGSREQALVMLMGRWYSSGIIVLLIFGMLHCSHSLLHGAVGTVHSDLSALDVVVLNVELQRQMVSLQSGPMPPLQRLLPISVGSCGANSNRCVGATGPLWKGDMPLLFFSVHVELDKVLGLNSLNVSNVLLSAPTHGLLELQICGRFEAVSFEGRATAVGDVTLPETSVGFCATAQATCLPLGGFASLALQNATLVGPLQLKLPRLLGGADVDLAALGGREVMCGLLAPLFHEGSMGASTRLALTHWIDANAGGKGRWKCA